MDDLTRRQLEMERRVYRLEDLVDKELLRSNAATMAAEYLGNVLTLEWTYTGRETPACFGGFYPIVNKVPPTPDYKPCSVVPEIQLSGKCATYPEGFVKSIRFESYNTRLAAWIWIATVTYSHVYEENIWGMKACYEKETWTYSDVVNIPAGTSPQGVPAMPAPYQNLRYSCVINASPRFGYSSSGIYIAGKDGLQFGVYDGFNGSATIDKASGDVTGVFCYGGHPPAGYQPVINYSPPAQVDRPLMPVIRSVTVTIQGMSATASPPAAGSPAYQAQANADAATMANQAYGILNGYSYTRAFENRSDTCAGSNPGMPNVFIPDTKLGTFSPIFLGVGRCAIDVFGGGCSIEVYSSNRGPLLDISPVHMSGYVDPCMGVMTSTPPTPRLYVGWANYNNTLFIDPAVYIGASSSTVTTCNPSKYPDPDRQAGFGVFGLGGFGGNVPHTADQVLGEPITPAEWTVPVSGEGSASGDKYDTGFDGRVITGYFKYAGTLKVKLNIG